MAKEMKIRFESSKEWNHVNALLDELRGSKSRNVFLKEIILKNLGLDKKEISLFREELREMKSLLQETRDWAKIGEGETRGLLYLYKAHNKIGDKAFEVIDLNGKHGVPWFVKNVNK